MNWMIKNSRGRRDALLTFSAGAVAVVLVKVLLNGVVAWGVTFGAIDAGVIAAVLAPTIGAYGWKRTTVDRATAAQMPPTVSVAAPPGGAS